MRPENDFNAYLVAWHYYIVDGWRFPLFSVPAMGYPEGGSVLFNDALPLAALLSKALYHVTGLRPNPFGWWILVVFVLQGAMAARLASVVGKQSLAASAAAAVFAVANTPFLLRIGHVALSGHFLLLWALARHFESLHRHRAKLGGAFAVLTVTLLVNAYLFVMVLVLEAGTLGAHWSRGHLVRRDLARAAAGIGAIAVLGIVAGYGIVLVNPSLMKGDGFGYHSWNLASLLLPPRGVFGYLAGVTRDATGGQYEGESYVGLGALMLLALCVVGSPVRTLGHVRQHWVLALTLLALAVYAASNVIWVGGARIVAYELPRLVADLGSYFRASGRFIWPLAYTLAILPVACIARWWRPAPALAAATLGVFLQVYESAPLLAGQKVATAQAYPDLINAPRVDGWMGEHQRLWQYPSWGCGGLAGARRVWDTPEANRELQVQLVAARAGIPSNSVYTSRALKDCTVEKAWASSPRLKDGVLYLVGTEAVQESHALDALARSSACVTLEWAVVCSKQWSRTADTRVTLADSRSAPGNPTGARAADAPRGVVPALGPSCPAVALTENQLHD